MLRTVAALALALVAVGVVGAALGLPTLAADPRATIALAAVAVAVLAVLLVGVRSRPQRSNPYW